MKSWFYGLCVRGDGAQVLLEIIRGMMKRKFCFRGSRMCRYIISRTVFKPLRSAVMVLGTITLHCMEFSMAVRLMTAAWLALTLAGCATNTPPKPISPMPEAEYAQLVMAQTTAGVGSISGKLYFTDRRGRVIQGNNSNMLMWPATPYTEKRQQADWAGIRLPDRMDPRIDQLTRRTFSNSSGEFRFDAVPAGAYFIWSYVDMNSIVRRVVVQEGQQTTVFLTND